MDLKIKTLRNNKELPVPNLPVVSDYAPVWGVTPHDIHLFPAYIKTQEIAEAEVAMEDGQATCFFHPHLPATAICEVSGRMICNLCTTEFEGKTVSFEALKSLVSVQGKDAKSNVVTKWDSIALALAVLPMIFWIFTIFTAPIALGICIVKYRKGPTGIIPRPRWRYWVAGLVSLAQIVYWVLLFTGLYAGIL